MRRARYNGGRGVCSLVDHHVHNILVSNAGLCFASETSPDAGPSASVLSRAFTTRRAGRLILLATLLMIAGPQSLPAQRAPAAFAGPNRATRTNSAQAVLHLTAIIVPSVITPQPAVERRGNRDFSISLPTPQLAMDVTSEWRAVPDRPDAALKTTTVVSR